MLKKSGMSFSFLVGFVLSLFLGCQSTPTNFNRQINNSTPLTTDDSSTQDQGVKYFTRLQDYSPFQYEVLFTDPICGPYEFVVPVKSNSGKILKQTPKDVYCKNKYDLYASGRNPKSPQYRIIQWIDELINSSEANKEIFFTYLTFSNRAVKDKLCEAAKKGVVINFVLSSGNSDSSAANDLVACNPNIVHKYLRGLEGDLGYAHNKFFIINPHSKNLFKIVFSSGNMTSGPVIHHENWNFITTNVNSHFAQAHLCAMNAELDEKAGHNRAEYIKSIQECRLKIKAPEETDIKVFFIPGEGEPEKGIGQLRKTAVDYMINGDGDLPGISQSNQIWIGCHRFFYNKMIAALKGKMLNKAKPNMRIVADDDTYYRAKDPNYTIGDTLPQEYYNIDNLVRLGAKAKFMQTNGNEHQLHHSKYLIFSDQAFDKTKPDDISGFKAVFTGSANLTGAGFNKNWENSYYITIPTVVEQFASHYVKMWNTMATEVKDLPDHGLIDDQLADKPMVVEGVLPAVESSEPVESE